MIHWAYHSVFDPGNILATMLIWVPAAWLARREFMRLHDSHKRLHAKIDALVAPSPPQKRQTVPKTVPRKGK